MLKATLTALLVTTAATLPAGELKLEHVPADATWIVHVDMENAREMFDTDELRDNERVKVAVNSLNRWLQSRYGMDQDELRSLTQYGTAKTDGFGIALVYADFSEEKVRKVVADEPNYRTSKYEGVTLHTWSAAGASTASDEPKKPKYREEVVTERTPGQPPRRVVVRKPVADGSSDRPEMTAAFVDGRTAIFASTPDAVKSGLDSLRAEDESLDPEGDLFMVPFKQGSIVYGAAKGLDKGAAKDGWEMLQGVSRAAFILGEKDLGKANGELKLETASDAAAAKMHDVIVAVKTAAQFVDPETSDDAAGQQTFLMRLAKTAELDVEQDGRIVAVDFTAHPNVLASIFNDIQAATAEGAEAAADAVEDAGDDVEEAADEAQREIER